MTANPNILIVDDKPHNIMLLSSMLKQAGYNVKSTTSGMDALQEVKNDPPGLILLDINMPEMDGYEVCRKLKSDEKSKDIPVIFLSAMTETEDKVKGFENGGIDYITKPFQFEEVKVRVKNHIALSELKIELKKHNENLEKLVRERTMELEAAYKRLRNIDRLKGEFIEMIAHEFRTPLTGILGVAEYLFNLCNNENADADFRDITEIFDTSRARILKLMEDAMSINNIETSAEKFSVGHVPVEAILTIGAEGFNYSPDPKIMGLFAPVDAGMISGAMKTINSLAKCFIKKEDNATLEVSVENDSLLLKYALDNLTVPEADIENFFEISSSARCSTYAQKLGLSPVVARKILNLFGGELNFIKNTNECGRLIVTIPTTGR
jgi:DNA-binding response OmpR family regulator